MEDLDPLIAKEEHPSLENNMRRLLKNVQEDRDAESYTQDWGKGMLKFFRLFSKDGVINITDLEKFKDILQKEDPVTERLSEFSPDFQTQYEEDFAPEILQLENDDLWNNTPTA